MQAVFLLSQPRAGSTLLQRMLAAHPQISTAPEPWLLLAPVYALREGGVYAEYSHATASKALRDLVQRLPGGEREYLEAALRFGLDVYASLSKDGATHFLDKTPRYSLIIRDLLKAAPDGRFIVLWRNPLAVAASLVDTFNGNRFMPHLHTIDLYDGLEQLCECVAEHPTRFHTLRYEDLVQQPTEQLARLLQVIGVPWNDAVIKDFTQTNVRGVVGDPSGVHRYHSVSEASLQRWQRILASPVRKRWSRRYLDWVGDDRLDLMGYRRQDLLQALYQDGPRPPLHQAFRDQVRMRQGQVYQALEVPLLRAKLRSSRESTRWHT